MNMHMLIELLQPFWDFNAFNDTFTKVHFTAGKVEIQAGRYQPHRWHRPPALVPADLLPLPGGPVEMMSSVPYFFTFLGINIFCPYKVIYSISYTTYVVTLKGSIGKCFRIYLLQ